MPIKDYIRTIPDFPTEGILFRDITGLLENAEGLREALDLIVERYHEGDDIDVVAGIEARGFIFGAAVAARLGVGFIPLRKPGKLPGPTLGVDYELEYGTDRLEMHVGAMGPGNRVLIIDDLIATGGTAEAAVRLVREAGASPVECCFVIDLPDLGGADRIRSLGCPCYSLCAFEGH